MTTEHSAERVRWVLWGARRCCDCDEVLGWRYVVAHMESRRKRGRPTDVAPKLCARCVLRVIASWCSECGRSGCAEHTEATP